MKDRAQQQDNAASEFPRGFLNFLTPEEPIEKSIMSVDDIEIPEPPELPPGTFSWGGLHFSQPGSVIQFDVSFGDREAKYYNIQAWGERLVELITEVLSVYYIDGMRRWQGFCLNVHLKSGRVIKYPVSYEAFKGLIIEFDSVDGSRLKAKYKFAGQILEEEVLLLEWLFKQPPIEDADSPDSNSSWRHQSMGPNVIRTAEDFAKAARKDAINQERTNAVFRAVVICLARQGFLSRRKCETEACAAIAWPIVHAKQGQAPLSVRFCPQCEREYRLAQKRKK